MKKLIDHLEEGIIALLIASMTLLTFSQVVMRYIFEAGLTWALELTEFMFAWLIFLGMSYGVKKNAHIGVDALVRLLPRGGQRIVGLIGSAACVAYAVIILIGAWNYVSKMYVIGIDAQDLPVPRWIPLAVLPIGFALLALRFFEAFVKILLGRSSGLGLADEAGDALKLDASRNEEGRA